MALRAAAAPVLLAAALIVALTAGAGATTFTIVNQCGFTVWPAATPVGGGTRLDRGQTWNINVPAGTSSGRVWGRTGCSFDGAGRGHCQTGDCGGALSCTLSGQPPLTLAEFTLGGPTDYYDISVIDGYNLPMDFSCNSGDTLRCRDPSCPDAYHTPPERKTHPCRGNSGFRVVFCP